MPLTLRSNMYEIDARCITWIIITILLLVVSNEGKVQWKLKTYPVKFGGDVTIVCTCPKNVIMEHMAWKIYPDGRAVVMFDQPVNISKYNVIIAYNESDVLYFLVIKKFEVTDIDYSYKCEFGFNYASGKITKGDVIDKLVVTISAQPSRVVSEGQDLKLNCRHAENDSDVRISWTRNGTNISVNDSTYIFESVKRQEAGEYTCEVFTQWGHGVGGILIEIQYPPHVTIIQRQHKYTYILECIANGIPNKYLFSNWEHKTEFYDHVRFVEGSPNGSLSLHGHYWEEFGYYQNSGIYFCNVSNNISDSSGSKHQMANIDLKFKGRPIFLSGSERNQHAIYGMEGVIQLFVYSFPKYQSIIIFTGQTSLRLHSDNQQEKYYIEESEGPVEDKIYGSAVTVRAYRISVRIKPIIETDFTNHTIIITNSLGTAAFTVRLIPANEDDKKSQTTQYSIFLLVLIMIGISTACLLCWYIMKELKKKVCANKIQHREIPQQHETTSSDYHYEEIASVSYVPHQIRVPVVNLISFEPPASMESSVQPNHNDRESLIESNELITIFSNTDDIISNKSAQHHETLYSDSNYEEIASVSYVPQQVSTPIVNTLSSEVAGSMESSVPPNPNDEESFVESIELITILGNTDDRISNRLLSQVSDESYQIPCKTYVHQHVQTSPDTEDELSASSDDSETLLKSFQKYESLLPVNINEHPYK